MQLKDVMNRRVECVTPETRVPHAVAMMDLRRVHQLVVKHGEEIVGLVTREDLSRLGSDAPETVLDVMRRHVVTATPDLTVRQAANLMRGHSIGALPIVDKGRLIGIVTVSDLLELLGKGAQHRVDRRRRWTLRHRGIRPQRTLVNRH